MRSRRRQLIVALSTSALGVPFASFAQQQSARIGFLAAESASDPSQSKRLQTLRSGLVELGYRDGGNLVIETRWAEGKYERLPALAGELVDLRVAAIVASGTKALMAARSVTTIVPIVMGSSGDAVALGVTTSLARPSANVTGWTFLGTEVTTKLVEILKEAAPRISRAAWLWNPADPPAVRTLQAMQATAGSLNLGLSPFEARSSNEFAGTFADIAKARCDAVLVQGDTLFAVSAARIAELALNYRLPSASVLNEYAEVGGLISVRTRQARRVSPRGSVHRSHSQRRKSHRSANRASNQLRFRHQHEDREITRARDPAVAAGARAGDLIRSPTAA